MALSLCFGCGDSGSSSNHGGAGGGGGNLGGSNLGGGGVDPSGDKQPTCGEGECLGNYSCGTEAQAACGDALNNTPCQLDDECAGVSNGAYCYAPCGACAPACGMPTDCKTFEDCVGGRCVGSCVDDADCPTNFGCVVQGADKTCVRKGCATDADCDGYCVLHECQSELGACVCQGC